MQTEIRIISIARILDRVFHSDYSYGLHCEPLLITPPGLDEQWLISVAHGQTEIDMLVEDFREFAKAIRA